jgi:hypothetical protein
MSMTKCSYNKTETSYLVRTSGNNYTNYWGDGQGRDGYIVTNNGGNTQMHKGMPNTRNRAPREL